MKTRKAIFGAVLMAGVWFFAGQATAMVSGLKGKGSVGGNLALSDWSIKTEHDRGYSDEWELQQLTIDVNVNYFLTDSFEIGIRNIMSKNMDNDDDSGSNYFLVRGAFNLYAPGATFVPYVGPQIGYYYQFGGDDDRKNTATATGGFLGFKNFISEDLSVNLELNYLSSKIEDDELTTTITETKLLIGFTYYFGGY